VLWWVEPEHRGDGLRLLREAESRAKLANAKYMQMIAPTEAVETVYKRLGYQYVESTYQRAL
jgi:GNAT superfamily N-acetyltransferase